MAEPSDHAAFIAANRFCVLGTLRKDGRARLSPMSYIWQDGTILISTMRTRGGGRTATRDGRVTVCVIDLQDTRRYLTIYGSAEVVTDEALSLRIFSAFAGKELEGDALAAAQRRIADEGRVVLRITPREYYPR